MLLLLQAYADSQPAGRLPKPAHLAHGRPGNKGCPVNRQMHDEMAVGRDPLNQSSRSRSSAPGLTAFRGSRLSSCPMYQFIVCRAEAKARLSSRAGKAIRSFDLIATACLLRPEPVGPAPLKDADSTVHGTVMLTVMLHRVVSISPCCPLLRCPVRMTCRSAPKTASSSSFASWGSASALSACTPCLCL